MSLDEVGRYLGIGIANLINAFNPSLVVLGGVLSLAGPYILPRAQREVNTARPGCGAQRRGDHSVCVQVRRVRDGRGSLILHEILNNPARWRPKPPSDSPSEDHVRLASVL